MTTQLNSSVISSEVMVETLLDGQVLCLTILSSSRAAVDRYVEIIKDTEKDWPSDRVGYFICDFSSSPAGFNTPYGKSKINELMAWRPEITTYSAVIVQNSFMFQIARIVLNKLSRQRSQTYLCSTRQQALEWLQKMISQQASAQGK